MAAVDKGWRPGGPTAALVAMVLVLAASTPATGQGSMGGTIGKQDKSLSGNDGASAPKARRAPPRQAKVRKPVERAPRAKAISLTGLWRWTGHCARYTEPYTGTVTLSQIGTDLTGTHGNTNIWDGGIISNGRVTGNRVSFVRTYMQYTDHVDLVLSGSGSAMRMTGVIPNTQHSGAA